MAYFPIWGFHFGVFCIGLIVCRLDFDESEKREYPFFPGHAPGKEQ